MELQPQKNTVPNLLASTEQEAAYLRERAEAKTKELEARGEKPMTEAVLTAEVKHYADQPHQEVIDPKTALVPERVEEIVLALAPESHDEKMAELLSVMQKSGIKNAMRVAHDLGIPHLEDDFHRFLVQYLKSGYPAKNIPEKTAAGKALQMTLFEISLPAGDGGEQPKPLKEVLSLMDQFYAGMLSLSAARAQAGKNIGNPKYAPGYFSIEIAVSNNSDQFIFYVTVPDYAKDLFEKQALAIFHNAHITPWTNDYNIFNYNGESACSVATLKQPSALPIKLYEQFDHDPLNVLLNSFSKIQKEGEGAAMQFIIHPSPDDHYPDLWRAAIERLEKGEKMADVLKSQPKGFWSHMGMIVKETLVGPGAAAAKKKQKEAEAAGAPKEPVKVDQMAIEAVRLKTAQPIALVNVRLIASAAYKSRAEAILSDMEATFNQFEDAQRNKIVFGRKDGRRLATEMEAFTYRLFDANEALPLNIREITTLVHFPMTVAKGAPQLKTVRATTAPAPINIPAEGLFLGVNDHRGQEKQVFMSPEDRLRHMYVIGQTGTGKTTLLKTMIIQDILAGQGACFIDPHGSDVEDILAHIPENRYEDVIYFDPAYTERPMALNMLEYDPRFPEQKTFVVNEMLSIFNKLFDMKTAGGPMFEQYFRNAVLLTIEDPETGSTLLDVSRVLSNKQYRELKLSKCKNPIVTQFWREVAEKAGGEASLQNIVPYIVSKFDNFLANDIMRPVIAQEKSSFNFREIMDGRKILLVNLSKGRLGDINANLIGLILVGKILMAALSRVDAIGKDMPPFYLYIDEFQNVTTDSIATILSEARKYKLSLTIAHQFIAQIQDSIRDAVFGNVGSMAVFRVGAADAELLEKQFAPVFAARDIMDIETYNAYMKLLINGIPAKPFNVRTPGVPKVSIEHVDPLKRLSYLKYGGDKAIVEAAIMEKYKKAPAATAAPVTPAAPSAPASTAAAVATAPAPTAPLSSMPPATPVAAPISGAQTVGGGPTAAPMPAPTPTAVQ